MSFQPKTNCKHSEFPYSAIPCEFDERFVEQYCDRLREKFAIHTKAWSTEKNIEWLGRHYLAIKMILSASIMLLSLRYCHAKNVKIVESYLCYYSILSCSRALLFTLPDVHWNDGELMAATHTKILNLTSDVMQRINREAGQKIKLTLNRAKSLREMYSYRFPSLGLELIPEEHRITLGECIEICTLICELAQMHSEVLEASLFKNVIGRYSPEKQAEDESIIESCFNYEITNGEVRNFLLDEGDWYRIGRMLAKNDFPFNLQSLMTEGMVEDFFDVWEPSSSMTEGVFDPQMQEWSIIFPVP